MVDGLSSKYIRISTVKNADLLDELDVGIVSLCSVTVCPGRCEEQSRRALSKAVRTSECRQIPSVLRQVRRSVCHSYDHV